MHRESFNSLLQDLMPYKENSIVPMEKQVLIFIKYLSNQMPFQSIADNYGVCEFTVLYLILSDVVCAHLLEKYIIWPEAQKVQETVQGFMNLKRFPGVLGAIDGSHIPIKTPVVCPKNYINRKSFTSIN
jgi:hypothetical protein